MSESLVELNAADVRALLRLSGEVRELGNDPDAWRRHLVAELGRLCDASVAIAFEQWVSRGLTLERLSDGWDTAVAAAPSPFVSAHLVDLGFDDRRARAHYYDYAYGAGRPGDPAFLPMLERVKALRGPPEGVTFATDELIRPTDWARSPFVQEHLRASGVGGYVLSLQFSHALQCSLGLTIARPWGAKPFSRRELALVDFANGEIGRTVREGDAATTEALPRRQRQTLALLLEGRREKEIAGELGIAPATVHDYVKALYRRFGVSSRAELSAHFAGGKRRAGLRLRGAPSSALGRAQQTLNISRRPASVAGTKRSARPGAPPQQRPRAPFCGPT